MPSAAVGEVLPLVWDGDPVEYYVRGHVDRGTYLEALADYLVEFECDEDAAVPYMGPLRYYYARWVFASDLPEGCTHALRVYSSPGNGRFAVTHAHTCEFLELKERSRERAEHAEAEVRRRWPQATVTDVSPGVEETGGYVTFKFPGSRGTARWNAGNPRQVWVQRRDVEAWKAYIATLQQGEANDPQEVEGDGADDHPHPSRAGSVHRAQEERATAQ